MGKGNNHNNKPEWDKNKSGSANDNQKPKTDLWHAEVEPYLNKMEENIVNTVYEAGEDYKKAIIDKLTKDLKANTENNYADKVSHNNQDIKKIVENNYSNVKKTVEINSKDVKDNIKNFIRTENDNLHEVIDGQFSDIRKIIPDSSKLDRLSDDLVKLSRSIETIEGTNKKLDEQVYDINKVLKDKNLVIKQTLPSVNHDEESLVQLAEYGQKIIEQLLLSGRWYARERSNLENIAEERKRYAREKEEAVKAAIAEGEKQGRIKLVKEILKKFDNKHSLMSGEIDGSSGIIAAILNNEGVTAKYKIGEVIDITAENINSYMGEIKGVELGKICIVTPCYYFDGEVIEKAEWENADKPEENNTEDESESTSANNDKVVEELETDHIQETEDESESTSANNDKVVEETEIDHMQENKTEVVEEDKVAENKVCDEAIKQENKEPENKETEEQQAVKAEFPQEEVSKQQ